MKSKCGGCEAPRVEDSPKGSANPKPVTRRKAWNGPKERVSKVNRALRTAAKPLRRREARNAPKAWNGPTKAIAAIQLFAIKIIFGKEWCIMMAMFFAQRVILGKTTFEQVPKALKKGVAEVLIDSGLPELVPTEYGGTADGE